jgi:hypothetical protein
MSKKSDRRRTADDKSFAITLQATGLGQLKTIKPTRRTPIAKPKGKKK